ncbi:MAG: nucleotidyltransferase domain-containing protein [Cellvibrionaceae bacterium]
MNAKPGCVSDLIGLLDSPEEFVDKLTLEQWDLIVSQARSVGMLGRLFHILDSENVIHRVPDAALRHFRWGDVISRRHVVLVGVEVDGISKVLSSLAGPIILLKGAAYSYGNIDALKGRIFTDIDLLVGEEEIGASEGLLERNGWLSSHMSEYDQRYYRRWMHELPPMKHGQRQTELDLHHAILPKTSRFKTDTNLLFRNAVPINSDKRLYRLSDDDLLLHSAAHLFFDGEFNHGFRDLEDIRSMMTAWQGASNRWSSLIERAACLGISNPLYFALYFSREWFSISVPDWVLIRVSSDAKLGVFRRFVLIFLFRQSLLPIHSSCSGRANSIARYFLYLRSHYLRMPLRLLIPHLVYKAFLPTLERLKEMRRERSKGDILQRLIESKADRSLK